MNNKESRRQFLKDLGTGLAGVVLAPHVKDSGKSESQANHRDVLVHMSQLPSSENVSTKAKTKAEAKPELKLVKTGESLAAPEAGCSPEPKYWQELSPLTSVGGEYMGAVSQELVDQRLGKLTNEIRVVKIPENPDFPDTSPIVMSSRLFITGKEDETDGVLSYGGQRVFFMPKDQKAGPPPAEKYTGTISFGTTKLDYINRGKDQSGRINIWECDFYYQNNLLPTVDVSSIGADVAHLGKYPYAGFNRAMYATQEASYILKDTGPVRKTGNTIMLETEYEGYNSFPVPESGVKDSTPWVSVVRIGALHVVDGLTEKPFSIISEPEISDRQGWQIVSLDTGKMSLSTRSWILDKPLIFNLEVQVDPDNLDRMAKMAKLYSEMYPDATAHIRSTRKIPFFTDEIAKLNQDIPINKNEFQFELVLRSGFIPDCVIPLNVEKTEKIVPQDPSPRGIT